jgi:hypothetical protein
LTVLNFKNPSPVMPSRRSCGRRPVAHLTRPRGQGTIEGTRGPEQEHPYGRFCRPRN